MLCIAPAPSGAKLDSRYSVWVRQGQEEWRELSVYVALTPDGTSNWIKIPEEIYKEYDGLAYGTVAEKTCFSSFAFDGTVDVRVQFHFQMENCTIKPRDKISYKQHTNEIQFSLEHPCKLDIEPDGDILGCIHIFADGIKEYQQDDYTNVIRFDKGYHTAENNKNIVYNSYGIPVIKGITDNTLIYAEQGAVVCAVIEIENAKHVKVSGEGVFSLLDRCYGAEKDFNIAPIYAGFRYHALPSIYVHAKCEDIVLEDITLLCEFRGISIRNAKNISIDNVKIFSHAVNGDGINCINVRDAKIKNCYIHSSDDSFALFTECDSIPTLIDKSEYTMEPYVGNITMCDCTLWTNARAFMIGGHATNQVNPHDLIENVSVQDCEIVGVASDIKGGRTYEHRLYWSGVYRILSQSEQHIRNIHFKNIRFDWTDGYEGKPIHMEVRNKNAVSYNETGGGYRIEDVSFENLEFINVPTNFMPNYIKSIETENLNYGIFDVVFQGITFNGRLMNIEDILQQGNIKNIK